MTIIKSVLVGSVAALASATFASASCQVFNGLTYCNSVSGISYENVGGSGSYNIVAGMKSVQQANGQYKCECQWGGTKSFGGPTAPLDEGLSLHFRGPLELKQIAFYQPGSKPKRNNNKKRHGHSHGHHAKRHGHGHLHRRAMEVVTVTSTVVVNHHGETIFPVPTPKPEVQAQGMQLHSKPKESPKEEKPKEDKPKGGNGGNSGSGNGGNSGSGNGGNSGKGDDDDVEDLDELADLEDQGESGWLRKAYFNADSGTTDGMVVMNYMGGEPGCSGEWSFGCGSSLSYASGPKTCTKGPSPLTKPNLASDEEFIIFSSEKCGENDPDCGFSYGPAHKGFAGAKKIFMFEFRMPRAAGGDTSGPNYDIPAIWSLNARAPRTQQYGDCSCWNSGCGELDMFEVIKGAADKIKTHFHSKQGKIIGAFGPGGGGGSPDYFERPTDKFVKAAVVFDGSKTIKITLVPDNVSFSEYFDDKYAENLKNGLGQSKFSSFTVG